MEEDFTVQRLYKQNKILERRIKRLQDCDDSSTKVIGEMDIEIKDLKKLLHKHCICITCGKQLLTKEARTVHTCFDRKEINK